MRFARWCVYAVAVAAPLATTAVPGGFPLTHDVVELPKQALVRLLAFGALALVAGALALRGGVWRAHRAWWVLGGFAAWTALATALSASPATSLIGRNGRLDGLVTTLTYCALAFAAGQLLAERAALRAFVRAAVATSIAVSAYAVLQNLRIEPLNYLDLATAFGPGRAFATLGNPVFLGGYLALVLPLAVVVVLADTRLGWRYTGVAAIAFGLPAMLATFTRGAWIALGVEVVLFAVVIWRRRCWNSTLLWVAVAAGAIWAAALATVSIASPSRDTNVLTRIQLASGDSITERLLIWRGMLAATARRPVLGYGPDMAQLAFEANRPVEHARLYAFSAVDNAHDWPLQLSATVGVVGAAFALAAWGWALVGTAAEAFSRETERDEWLVTGAWIALAGYAVHLLSAVAPTGSQAIAWALVGALLGARATSREVAPLVRGRVAQVAAAGGLVVAWLALLAWTGALLAADHAFLENRAQLRGDEPGSALVSATRASALSPLDAAYVAGIGNALAQEAGAPQPIAGGGTSAALNRAAAEAYARAARLDAGDWTLPLLEADQWRAAGETARAKAVLAAAEKRFPENPYVAASVKSLGTLSP